MSSSALGAVIGATVCVVASPYLAGLVRTVPDKGDARWWRVTRVATPQLARTALVGVVLGGLAGAAAGVTAVLPAFLVLAVVGTPLVMIDVAHHRLPNRLAFPLAAAAAVLFALAAVATRDGDDLLRAVEGAAAVFAALAVLKIISPRSFGFGDVKIGGVLGGYLGWFGWGEVYYGIFAGFLLGAVVAVALLATRRATMKTAIAFGPSLVVGALIVLALDLVPTGLR